MFSKALFKQSCKANKVMWSIITFAVCFMLACVMLISGNGNIGKIKDGLEDTIITGEISAQIKSRSLNYYQIGVDGLKHFDNYFVANFNDVYAFDASVTTWLSNEPSQSNYATTEEYQQAMLSWKQGFPQYTTTVEALYSQSFATWQNSMPEKGEQTDEEYNQALALWKSNRPTGNEYLAKLAYTASANDLTNYEEQYALSVNPNYTKDTNEAKELLGASICALDPSLNATISKLYTENSETLPASYDVQSLLANLANINEYLTSDERVKYIESRAQQSSSVYLAGNMTTEDNINEMINALSDYGVTKEKYDSFGYTYSSINHTAQTTIISYQGRYDYELSLINEKFSDHTTEEYASAVKNMNTSLTGEITSSLLSTLPSDVSNALEEVGQMDMFSLIVGSIFFKMAGLLLPIIYMIMVANNLVAGQVDSGSMAYILSTSTKRKQVIFTQAVFLVGSLLAMFSLTTITSVICLSIVKTQTTLTYSHLILLNLGAFITMFALSGISFLASCWFNRTKYSMSIGGGLNMFFLVSTMLGLFGSKVLPSVIRLNALNFFNYTSLISLFDVVSILGDTTTFIWKLAILVAVGLICYIIGGEKFKAKDLPL